MNRVEAQNRIIRNLAVIQHQVGSLAKNGQNMSAYSEGVIKDSLNAATGLGWTNLNAAQNNAPAIDLISADGTRGVQATLQTTKQKFDKTVASLTKELERPGSALSGLRQVEVVGLTCVSNVKVTTWSTLPKHSMRVRGIDLLRLLALNALDDEQLADVDDVMQGAATTGPFHVNSDKDEIRTIIAYLDRSAIRHSRHIELDWHAMGDAMRSIGRLLTQGADDTGHQITRPYRTFQPPIRDLLYEIYRATTEISLLLRNELRSPGTLTQSEGVRIDGYRLQVQETVTTLANEVGLPPPIW